MKQAIRAIWVLLALLIAPWATASAQTAPITVRIEQIGFDGHGRVGGFVPVVVAVQNTGADTQGLVVVRSAGSDATRVQQPLDLAGGAQKQITLLYPANLNTDRLVAQFVVDADTGVQSERVRYTVHDRSESLIGVFGAAPTALSGLNLSGSQTTVVYADGAALPATDAELLNFTTLVLGDVSPTIEQVAMLQRWVAAGGVLLLDAGPSRIEFAATLSDLVPATPDMSAAAITSATLSSVNATPLDNAIALQARAITPAADASVLAADGDRALIVARSLGMGRVVLTAFDVPAVETRGTGKAVWEALLVWNSPSAWTPSVRSLTFGGDSGLPRTSTLALLLLGYILVIGPLNYLVLKRLDKREWAWLTIPAAVLLWTGIAYVAGAGLRTSSALGLQVAVVDTAPGMTDGRVTAAAGFAAGRRGTWTMNLPPNVVAGSTTNSFFGESRSDVIQVNADASTVLPSWAANIGDVREALVVGAVPLPFDLDIDLRFDDSTNFLAGSITNRGAEPLNRAFLLLNDRFVELPQLASGASYTVDAAQQQSGFPYSVTWRSNFDPSAAILSDLWGAAETMGPVGFGGGMPRAHDGFTIYTAPRLLVVRETPALQTTLEGSDNLKAITLYNIYLSLEPQP